MMFEAQVSEFPFVGELPKREKSKVAKLWDVLKEFRAVQEREGDLVPLAFAVKLLDISHQRGSQLCEAGRLKRIDFGGVAYVTEASLVDWAKAEHRNGRPPNMPKSAGEMWKRAVEVGKAGYKCGRFADVKGDEK